LLYRHALSLGEALELTPKERILTKTGEAIMFSFIAAPAVSIAIALLLHFTGNDIWVGPGAGFIYPIAITLAITIVRGRSRRELAALEPQSVSAALDS